MSLDHLTIRHEESRKGTYSGSIEALFNPNQLAYTRTNHWSPLYNARKSIPGFNLKYESSAPETLTLELFFDTYAAPGAEGSLLGLLPSSASSARSVLEHTDKVEKLSRIAAELDRPPICKLSWGESFVFQGVLQQATRTLQLFLENGTPVRATMNCTFMECPDDTGDAASEQHSPDVAKKYVVRPGDTLMGIAAALYGDTSPWRRIADANRLENPRRLTPGQTLVIPRLR
jgi:hypothetical protein